MGVALPREEPRGGLKRARVAFPGGAATTVYATSHPEASTEPFGDWEVPERGGRAVSTALLFLPR